MSRLDNMFEREMKLVHVVYNCGDCQIGYNSPEDWLLLE